MNPVLLETWNHLIPFPQGYVGLGEWNQMIPGLQENRNHLIPFPQGYVGLEQG